MGIDPLYLFVFAGLFSPGPNVIMLTTSGARFGFYKTLPHLFGVVLGVGIIAGITGFGIGTMLIVHPNLQFTLRVLSSLWIFYTAVQLWQSTLRPPDQNRETPFTFFQAVLFQWVNSKVWAVAISASAGYSIGLGPVQNAFRLAMAFSGLNLFVCLFWSFAGSLLAVILGKPQIMRIFLRVMSVLLAASAVMIFF